MTDPNRLIWLDRPDRIGYNSGVSDYFHSIIYMHYLIDDYYAGYRNQSNRWSRSTSYCRCFRAKSSNISLLLLFLQTLAHCLIQTLIKLSLHLNQIGPQGAYFLANGLRQNQVIFIHSTFSFTCSLTYLHRRWPDLTSITIKSAMRERNILPMLCNKTK